MFLHYNQGEEDEPSFPNGNLKLDGKEQQQGVFNPFLYRRDFLIGYIGLGCD